MHSKLEEQLDFKEQLPLNEHRSDGESLEKAWRERGVSLGKCFVRNSFWGEKFIERNLRDCILQKTW